MKLTIIGAGYVGLVTATCFADMGNMVSCVDIDGKKIDLLRAGNMPIYEPGLESLVEANVKAGRLAFSTRLDQGLKGAQFCFIAVSTPASADGSADLSYVLAAAEEIGAHMQDYLVIVNKSTVPVGTSDRVRATVRRALEARGRADLEFDVVSNPEFLKEGAAIEDFMRPDRVVIGAENARAADLMKQLYEPFVRNQNPLLFMDCKSAEITKYAANAMLAARISFMNEIARLCDAVGGDIEQVRAGIGFDRRIGAAFLYAGAGYGGSCFPKDVKELIATGTRAGCPMSVAKAVEEVNGSQKAYIITKIDAAMGKDLRGRLIAVWGLAFKPQTDDMREAPSVEIVRALRGRGARLRCYDPVALDHARAIIGDEGIEWVDEMYGALDGADALVLVTEWKEFRQPDFGRMRGMMRAPRIFDCRNQYDPAKMLEAGFEYRCIGRNK